MDDIITLDQAFEAYRRAKLRGASDGTINQFRVTIKHFAEFLDRHPGVRDLTNEIVTDFLWAMKDGKRSPATCNKARANLLAIWRWLVLHRRLDTLPDVEKMQEPQRIPIAWDREQLRKLWRACEDQPGRIAGVPAGLWWLTLHSLAWDTGERVTAIRSLAWFDVSLDAGTLVIRAETRKGKSRDRAHTLHPQTVNLLRRIREPLRSEVFAWPFSHSYLWIRYRLMRRKAGLPDDRRHAFHALRRSVATWFEAAGGDATRLLDHSTRDVTIKHYLDSRLLHRESASALLFRPDAATG